MSAYQVIAPAAGTPFVIGMTLFAIIALVTIVFSGVITLVLGLILKATMGWRIDKDAETSGIDQDVHAESAYDLTASSGGRFGGAFADAGVTKSSTPAPPASITEGASA